MMPRFFRDMPPMGPGRYVACSQRVYSFRGPREVYAIEVFGRRRAYVLARLLALWDDWTCPFSSDDVGINWAVRSSKP